MKSVLFYSLVVAFSLALLPSCWLFKSEQKVLSFAFIDTLDSSFFDELHLKGALSIPFALENDLNPAYENLENFKKEIEKQTGATINESTELFFYCADEMCSSSKETADIATGWGLKGTKYASGIKGWYGLFLYDQYPEKYPLAPDFNKDVVWKNHSYLNSLTAEKPDQITLETWKNEAQPLVDAMNKK